MRLDVWLEAFARPVGLLERRDDKSLEFVYPRDAQPEHRISMSMPVRQEPFGDAEARAFFGNLLFEGRELDRVMAAHRLDRDDIGGLLYHLGADCPGAISVTPEGSGPGKRPGIFPDDYLALPPARLLRMVSSLHFDGRLPDDERNPSPVAGVQPKIALVYHDGTYFVPQSESRAPTTHILKISPATSPTITRHEAALLGLASELGFPAAASEAVVFDDPARGATINAILSTRFDRVFEGGEIRRIHTEDFCQALGLERHLKYECDATEVDHRFSVEAIAGIADRTAAPGLFRMQFLEQTLFNLAVGNTDNHGKNSSIVYRGRAGELAPLYDVVPVIMDPKFTHQLAFSIGAARWSEDVDRNELDAMMRQLGYRSPALARPLRAKLAKICDQGPEMLARSGDKGLGDAVAAQLQATPLWSDLGLNIAERDYFPRPVRDERANAGAGGWGGLS